jgi:pyridoxamine 5'-phosphate oxidase
MIINRGLSESMINQNPFIQFDKWYTEHLKAGIAIPNTVSLGTTFPNGHVSVRTVLLKEYNESGFVFYTNYNSKKGTQLLSTHKAALLFFWPYSGRQIRIEGIVKKMTVKESEDYFKGRPRESQIAAWASEQSSVIPDRQFLDDRYEFYKNKFGNMTIKRPPCWGGFHIVPDWFEFWQEGDFRLHDRLSYTRKKDRWIIERLAP